MDRPKSRVAPALIVAGILCAVPAVYLACYLRLGWRPTPIGSEVRRAYFSRWQALVFIPAAAIEARAKGVEIELWTNSDTGYEHDYEQVKVLSP
jgi:hypothetical protein